MAKIKILDDETVKLIAAGEVVERPASVVKELIENSLDAGAKKIDVSIKNGGKTLISVKDNGTGMSKEDALLSIEKHATSKISGKEDLNRIRTYGFRGEALYSISSVSKFEILTGQGDVSTYIYCEANKIMKIEERGPMKGTLINVMDLFFNLPARRKFMKSDMNEFQAIEEIFINYLFAREDVSFTLTHNGRQIFNIPVVNSLIDRFTYVYSPELAKKMLNIENKNNNAEIRGIISKPELTRKSKDHIYIYVNDRPVKSPEIVESIISAYGSLLFRDSFPIAIIKIYLDPQFIDVNVHPAKIFVKFSNENELLNLVKESIQKALKNVNLIPDIVSEFPALEKIDKMLDLEKQITFETEKGIIQKKIDENLPDLGSLKIVGQILDTYIIVDTGNGMLIVDQHAAHERIRTEKLEDDINRKSIQNLIDPITIKLEPWQIEILREEKDIFSSLNFQFDIFQNHVVLRTVPSFFKINEIVDAFIEGLNELGKNRTKGIEERKRETIATMACKGAIKANQKLSEKDMKILLYDLMKCRNPYTCPHGRPTMIKIGKEELEKMFKRKI